MIFKSAFFFILFLLASANHAMELPGNEHFIKMQAAFTSSLPPNMPILPEIIDNILNYLDETDHLIDRIHFLSTRKDFYNHGWTLVRKKYPYMDSLSWSTLPLSTEHECYHFNYLLTMALDHVLETWNWNQQLIMKMFLQENTVDVCCQRITGRMTDTVYPQDGAVLLEAWGYEKAVHHYGATMLKSCVLDDILKKYESRLKNSGKLFKGLLRRAQPEQGYFYNWTGLGWFKSKEEGFLTHLFGLFEELNRKKIALWDIIKAELKQTDAFDVPLKPDIKSLIEETIFPIFAFFEQHTKIKNHDYWRSEFPSLRDDIIYPKHPEEIILSRVLNARLFIGDQLYFKGGDKKANAYIVLRHPLDILTDQDGNALAFELPYHELEALPPHFKSILLSKAKVIEK